VHDTIAQGCHSSNSSPRSSCGLEFERKRCHIYSLSFKIPTVKVKPNHLSDEKLM